ncbi:MAG: hypothetical protein HUK40_00260 [Desulfobacter sp.]|nr:hypothetical protein [Desulfobacter sp.]WDP85723.1 MAG: hypothetical protein HUN05_11760 [Desulfobacter sp.]
MNKKILIKTDDPEYKKFYLTITGKVNQIFKMTPKIVSLSGVPGQELEAVVTITPALDYDFEILSLIQKFNTQIKAELIRPEKGQRDWLVKIKSKSDKPDDLYDVITLKTNSPYKKSLKIRVYAIYFEEIQQKS